jgi:hypothetical protein
MLVMYITRVGLPKCLEGTYLPTYLPFSIFSIPMIDVWYKIIDKNLVQKGIFFFNIFQKWLKIENHWVTIITNA